MCLLGSLSKLLTAAFCLLHGSTQPHETSCLVLSRAARSIFVNGNRQYLVASLDLPPAGTLFLFASSLFDMQRPSSIVPNIFTLSDKPLKALGDWDLGECSPCTSPAAPLPHASAQARRVRHRAAAVRTPSPAQALHKPDTVMFTRTPAHSAQGSHALKLTDCALVTYFCRAGNARTPSKPLSTTSQSLV